MRTLRGLHLQVDIETNEDGVAVFPLKPLLNSTAQRGSSGNTRCPHDAEVEAAAAKRVFESMQHYVPFTVMGRYAAEQVQLTRDDFSR